MVQPQAIPAFFNNYDNALIMVLTQMQGNNTALMDDLTTILSHQIGNCPTAIMA
jgi:hypothetical protein